MTSIPRNHDAAMQHARRLQLHEHPSAPAGLEVHRDGIVHETQRGDSAWGIARDYSQAFHMDITPAQLTSANRSAFADGLDPGERLRIPGLHQRMDTFMLAENPGLSVNRAGVLGHTVVRGDTLSSIARRYSQTNDITVSWQDLHAANRKTIGANPNRIVPGQHLVIPGVSTASPAATLQTLSKLDNDVVLTRTARVRGEQGGVRTIEVMRFHANGSHAEQHESLTQALTGARIAAREGRTPMAVVQTRDGAYHSMPLRGVEAGDLDHTDHTLSLAYRADDRAVVAVIDRDARTGDVTTRRFDR